MNHWTMNTVVISIRLINHHLIETNQTMTNIFLWHYVINSMDTNKTDIVRFHRFAHHRRIWYSPGHRTIFKNFLLRGHISYGRRPASYMIASADARPGTVRRCKILAGQRTVPGRFYAIFSGAMVNLFISKFAIIPLKKQVVKMKKIEADSDSDGDGNHTCSRLQTFQ